MRALDAVHGDSEVDIYDLARRDRNGGPAFDEVKPYVKGSRKTDEDRATTVGELEEVMGVDIVGGSCGSIEVVLPR